MKFFFLIGHKNLLRKEKKMGEKNRRKKFSKVTNRKTKIISIPQFAIKKGVRKIVEEGGRRGIKIIGKRIKNKITAIANARIDKADQLNR